MRPWWIGCAQLASFLLLQPRAQRVEGGCSHSGWIFPSQPAIMTVPYTHSHRWAWSRQFLTRETLPGDCWWSGWQLNLSHMVSTLVCRSGGEDWEVASSLGKWANRVPLHDEWEWSPVWLNSHLSVAIDSIWPRQNEAIPNYTTVMNT